MSSRYLPYASRPGRLLAQLTSDVIVIIWTAVWILVGVAVHSAVSTIAEVGRQVQGGATGVADNLSSAGDSTADVWLIGDTLSKPLRAASGRSRWTVVWRAAPTDCYCACHYP